jgi:NADH:ubiquinone reductase (non-electrogenic)
LASFKKSGVEVKTNSHISKVEPGVMYTEDGETRFGMLIWATGNKQVPLTDALSVSKSGRLLRIVTDDFLHPFDLDGNAIENAYAIGDAADIRGAGLPTTAEVACQKGSYLAQVFNAGTRERFKYSQRAMIAYTGQHDGVVAGENDWTGESAWLAWRSKNHSWASESWRNKIMISMNWSLNQIFGKEIARA